MRTLLVLIGAVALVSISKSNYYRVVKVDGNKVLIDRKGKLIKMYGYGAKEGDMIRLWGDYDFNYDKLTVNK